MRRQDRQITDNEKINEIIRKCSCCRLGFNDNGEIYIVPLSFGLEYKDGKRYLYFHSATEGRKIDLIKRGGTVGFEMDCDYELRHAEKACGHTAMYSSVIGTGKPEILASDEEKIHGLQCLMETLTGSDKWDYDRNMLDRVCVFRVEVISIDCKVHI